ncbi:MAG: hypothetical protein MJ172_03490 [Clostridia bacterium]|nr:hypothetical protein [Clostridia bacterium]
MTEEIIAFLKRYDEIEKLVLEQQMDDFQAKMSQFEGDEKTYEEYVLDKVLSEARMQMVGMEEEPAEELSGKSFKQYISEMALEDLIEVQDYCATMLDSEVPLSIINEIAGRDDREVIISKALAAINDTPWTEEELLNSEDGENKLFEMEFNKVKAWFSVLIKMNYSDAMKIVIDRFMTYELTREFVAEAISSYIEAFPDVSIPMIISRLDEAKEDGIKGPCEDLVMMLAAIGKEVKNDDVYMALKTAFRYMENKIYAVICLGEYGDNRAIPMLKGYINRHQETIERDVFYEILSAVQKLGGDTSDIQDPFCDFDKNGNLKTRED